MARYLLEMVKSLNIGDDIRKVRAKIFKMDTAIIKILEQRRILSKKMGTLKKKYNIPYSLRSEETQKIKLLHERSKGLNYSYVEKVFSEIYKESVRIQKNS